MALETKLVQKLSQTLTMTPQLQQAIKLLQLGRLEYKEALEKELLENPILEEARTEDSPRDQSNKENDGEQTGQQEALSQQEPAPPEGSEPKMDWEGYLESFTDYRGAAPAKGTYDDSERPSLEATLSSAESLEEHLLSQIRLLDLTREARKVALHMVGNLDKNGYLCMSHEELAETCNASPEVVSEVVEQLVDLDPPGIFSQNLQECLTNQLNRLGQGESLAGRIVASHLELLQKRKYQEIAKAEACPVETVYEAIHAIRKLQPRPGRPFNDESIRYITPDIYVQKVAGDYVVTLNEDGLPRLRVSRYYLKLLRQSNEKKDPNKAYLHERLKAATWLIKSIHQRQNTIFRVTESIVKFQRDFLDHGISRLKPLVLKEVADDIGMHESTVSRVTSNKYVHTPQGLYELKFFFTTGIKTANGEVSSSAVKERIKQLIAEEPAGKPISDQKIVEILKEEKVEIARRTVAKYREAMGILSSSKRKNPF